MLKNQVIYQYFSWKTSRTRVIPAVEDEFEVKLRNKCFSGTMRENVETARYAPMFLKENFAQQIF